jgi:hypothetical protein
MLEAQSADVHVIWRPFRVSLAPGRLRRGFPRVASRTSRVFHLVSFSKHHLQCSNIHCLLSANSASWTPDPLRNPARFPPKPRHLLVVTSGSSTHRPSLGRQSPLIYKTLHRALPKEPAVHFPASPEWSLPRTPLCPAQRPASSIT